MTNIVFLEVDAEDSARVRAQFPDALIISKTIAEAMDECASAEVISCFINSVFDEATLKKLPKLALLCTRSVGYDHIDLTACKKRNITVCNVPDYGSHVIAEHVFALLLSRLRHINEAERRTEIGTFDYHGLRGTALKDKTIGIIGTGKIGRSVAQIAHGFDMRILAVDKCRTAELEQQYKVRYVPLEELYQEADIVTLHIPATPATEHMMNDAAFQQMKDGVIIVNTARGSLIDSVALLAALKNGKIACALLDVLEHEHNFEENQELIKLPNVVTTPHIAFYADDSMRNMYLDCFESIEQWQRGETPTHEVKPVQIVCDLPGVQPIS